MYQHTQRSSAAYLVLFALPAISFAMAWWHRREWLLCLVLVLVGLITLLLAFSFQTLRIADKGDHLSVRYGPLPWLGTRIRYSDIQSVECGRTRWFDGWGIHWIPFRGWTLNLWGFECVKIETPKRVFRLGTDDSANLARFLRQRINAEQGAQA